MSAQYQPFSNRFNHERAVPITITNEAPDQLREFVLASLKHFYSYEQLSLDLVCLAIGKVPYQVSYARQHNTWGYVQDELRRADWYRIYDVIERLCATLRQLRPQEGREFTELINVFFRQNGYSYLLSENGKLEYRGEESFVVAVETADLALAAAGLETVRKEIHKALEDLGRRPTADLTGAVQHAMAGLECAAKEVTREPNMELGKIVKKYPKLFPPPLGNLCTSSASTA